MRTSFLVIVLALLVAAQHVSAADHASKPDSVDAVSEKAERKQIPRESKFTHLNEDGFALNVDPEIVEAGDAPMGEEDIVMGVVIGGEARAYPVNYMNGPWNEVVNDRLGGDSIAATW